MPRSASARDDQFAYAMSDMAPSPDGRIPAGVVSLPEGKGCGRQHHAQVDTDGHPYIKCAICAPWLVGHVHGFAATPSGVPLTPDEMGDVEISKRQGEVSYQLAMKALGQTMGQMLQAGQPQPVAAGLDLAGLKAQLSGMSAADRDELAALLRGQPADPPAPGPEDFASQAPAGPPAPPRRGPGRPRKNEAG